MEGAKPGAVGIVPGCSFSKCYLPKSHSLPGNMWPRSLPGPVLDTDMRRACAPWCQDVCPHLTYLFTSEEFIKIYV